MDTEVKTLNLDLLNSRATWALQLELKVNTGVTSLRLSTKTPGVRPVLRGAKLGPSSSHRDRPLAMTGGGYRPDQVHTKIIPPLNMKGLDHSPHLERDQKAIKLATDERRHYSVTNSDSSGTPQMTPKTGSSAAQTPDGQRTPLPRYILEHFDRDPPAYAESEPSRHAAREPPRRPTF